MYVCVGISTIKLTGSYFRAICIGPSCLGEKNWTPLGWQTESCSEGGLKHSSISKPQAVSLSPCLPAPPLFPASGLEQDRETMSNVFESHYGQNFLPTFTSTHKRIPHKSSYIHFPASWNFIPQPLALGGIHGVTASSGYGKLLPHNKPVFLLAPSQKLQLWEKSKSRLSPLT